MKSRYWLLLGLLVLVGAGVAIFNQRADAKDPSKKPIDFTLKNVEDKDVKLSDYRGKVVVVDVWATWCHFCVQEMPELITLQKEYTEDKKPVQFIGVSVDRDKAAVKDFVQEHKVNYPTVYGTQKALEPFGDILGLPTKFILNEKGVIVCKIIGATDKATLKKKIDAQLKD